MAEVVSLCELDHYHGLVNRIIDEIEGFLGKDALVVLDHATAGHVPDLKRLPRSTGRVCCVGPSPSLPPGIEEHPLPPGVGERERFFVAVGSQGVIAMAGVSQAPPRETAFTGAWSVHALHARLLLEAVLAHGTYPVDGPAPSCEHAMRVMVFHAEVLSHQRREATLDRADLFTVLDILKAISAKRRAHDILYVFVEQIAKSIACNRCSIVRVWGYRGTGHVLASHEDASVVDRHIDLDKYPELTRALTSESKVVINDVSKEPLTRPFANALAKAGIHALVVVPVVLFDENIGSLMLRTARAESGFSIREIGFLEVVCEAASNALQRAHLFESIQVANDRLEHLAVTDGLTGLFNHRYFVDRLEKEADRARRYQQPLSCMLIDVDNFKQINDTHGHLVGDSVLREIADCCSRCVRKVDTLARYGGEEFVVLMPQTDVEGGKQQAERLRKMIADHQFKHLPANTRITVSVGVGEYHLPMMDKAEDLLRAADDAAYTAKRLGKNRVVTHPLEGSHA